MRETRTGDPLLNKRDQSQSAQLQDRRANMQHNKHDKGVRGGRGQGGRDFPQSLGRGVDHGLGRLTSEGVVERSNSHSVQTGTKERQPSYSLE